MPTFSERLNEALEYRNMTAAELARALNVADAIMQLKSFRLYSLFLVALGQTEGCVLYKAKSRAEENPLPGRFLVLS